MQEPRSATPVEPIVWQRRHLVGINAARPAALLQRRFDFAEHATLRRSYIVASTPMCGSNFLCTRLWQTGSLGAPAEYFSNGKAGRAMMERLHASSPPDFLAKLLACRTSPSGIFGLNMNFSDFEEVQRTIPEFLGKLSPLTFVHLEHNDKLLQAAFMAKMVQRNKQAHADAQRIFRYDRNLISKWLGRIERQRLGWMRWFAANKVEPFTVSFERLVADPEAVVQSIAQLLGVRTDSARSVRLALADAPSDEISKAWVLRFGREVEKGVEERDDIVTVPAAVAERAGSARGSGGADARSAALAPSAKHIFDRYDEIRNIAARPIAALRLRHRYKAIIAANRELFRNASVLDIRSGDGRWSLAALDAGAARIVGLENGQGPLEVARTLFARMGIDPAAYEFVHGRLFKSLQTFRPGIFDLILWKEFSPEPYSFMSALRRLRAKHIIIDTATAPGKASFAVFRTKPQNKPALDDSADRGLISAVPSPEMITMFASFFGFRCRPIDWHTLGIADWTGIRDYERGKRGTYVLERALSPTPPLR